MFRLVGECRDLGADPEAWRRHITRSLGGLAGGQVGMAGEAAKPADSSTPGLLYPMFEVYILTPYVSNALRRDFFESLDFPKPWPSKGLWPSHCHYTT